MAARSDRWAASVCGEWASPSQGLRATTRSSNSALRCAPALAPETVKPGVVGAN